MLIYTNNKCLDFTFLHVLLPPFFQTTFLVRIRTYFLRWPNKQEAQRTGNNIHTE